MAGNYPDPPGNRLAYDRDGTLGYVRWSSLGTDVLGSPMTTAQLQAMNDESTATSLSAGGGVNDCVKWLIFPALRDISHVHISTTASNSLTFTWSANTTNGVDGTWTTVALTNRANNRLSMRNDFNATPTILGAKAIRWVEDNGSGTDPRTYTLHLYGKPTATSDRLEFWHPTLDQPLRNTPAHLDWGNRPRGTTESRQFRVKNISAAMTANNVTVSMEALTDASPTMVSQHTFSYQGSAAAASVVIPSLAPGAVSDLVTIQQALLSTAVVSLWDQRITAVAGSWT